MITEKTRKDASLLDNSIAILIGCITLYGFAANIFFPKKPDLTPAPVVIVQQAPIIQPVETKQNTVQQPSINPVAISHSDSNTAANEKPSEPATLNPIEQQPNLNIESTKTRVSL